jgi:polysaccharide chain length determinant protein (PEP-CTERM system associated)
MNMSVALYWRLFLRRLPAMLALFLLATGIGLVLAMRLPTTYQANARLLVEGQQIPDRLATATVSTEANEEIQIIREQLLTRTNLIEIANRFAVIPDISRVDPNEVVRKMRADTRITTSNARVQPIIVTVAFSAPTGQIAADVVNEYVTRIISANIAQRQGQAGKTLDFFQQEVTRLSEELDRRSTAIATFQSQNANALPSEQPFRLTRQSQLQERLAATERQRTSLIEQKSRLAQVYEATGQIAADTTVALSPDQQQLRALQSELSAALAIYSDTNPRVSILKSRIAQLERQIAAAVPADGTAQTPNATGTLTLYDMQVAQIDSQIGTLDAEIATVQGELATLATAISSSPANAIALQALQRDFDNSQSQYNEAVKRLATASTGERIELSAQGQRISQIESASVPSEPASPNRPVIAAGGAAVGVGLAGMLFGLLEILNRSIRIPSDITRKLGIIPLATIPYMETRSHLMMRRALQVTLMILVLVGIPAGLWALDRFYLPLDLLAAMVLDRIGLG